VSDAPAVTVAVPVYNSEKFLAETLRSILAQTCTDFEVVISDNASTDSTGAICEEFARADSRIRYIRRPRNIGLPSNYNSLVALARGRYFKWSSSNDLIQPRFLEACVPVLEANPDVVLVYPRTRMFDAVSGEVRDHADNLDIRDEDPVERYKQCDERLFANNIINGVIRTKALAASTLHREYPSSDLAMMPELSLYGKFVEVPEPLFYRRAEPGAIYGTGNAKAHKSYYPNDRFGSRRDWQFLRQMFSGVCRAPVTLSQRLRLFEYLAHRAWWKRRELLPVLWGFRGQQ
jgi:glycosyltransferase involved in cell wall biosynthesis